ncbi:hypothetical protein M409DRAFT_63618 [Zasmidium cellare ATCC 36951]|uniref:UBA domain-containing protein n=1 Tax=Zasmidium cellare ATCC 36951 TaxID=1080233 RepID=A0A6A6CVQ6_ZASCE|nr:uncharacterized protein M409DRAFT_63618 [Zasmidium cellare ATCC 36951]KAF2171267.1 hypothetical protein M409DRAFT_63618 [Zasmidium cellare ATCC 36951]
MGEGRYYASIDVAASNNSGPTEPIPQPTSQFRRSISIFSRRGTETPEPTPPFIAQAAMPRPMTERQKSWIGRRKSVCSQSPKSPKAASPRTPKTPKATILNAVPPAKTIQMTALEEEMATSPNEEILSAIAINERELTLNALNRGDSSPLSPIQQDMLRSKSTTSLATQRTKSQKRKDSQSRIGVWINGVVHWDDTVLGQGEKQEEKIEETGFTPIRPVSAGTQLGQQLAARKPHLSVVIPAGEPLINDRTLSTIVQPKPRRPVSVAPASIVTKFPRQPPAIVLEEPKDVSPLEQDSGLVISPPDRPHAPVHSESGRSHASRSSTSGSSVTTDLSASSRRSSATSVEALCASTQPNKDKAPPPLPVMPEREAPSPFSRNERISKTVRLPSHADMLQQESQMRHSRSMSELDRADRAFIRSSPYTFLNVHEPTSPTLSQAEKDLEDSLESIQPPEHEQNEAVDLPSRSGSLLQRSDSVRDVMQPPVRAPTIPKRSRKRDWRMTRGTKSLSAVPAPQMPTRRRSESQMKPLDQPTKGPTLRKSASISHSNHNSADLTSITERPSPSDAEKSADTPIVPTIVVDQASESVLQKPTTIMEADETATAMVPSESAENVLLHILASLKSIGDLFNTAVINKGMYRVFKENEMDLIRTVAFNESPAAWELREWSPPDRNEVDSGKASSQLEHTPMSYMRCFRRDQAVVERLKGLILQKCQTFIRRETTFALSTPTHPNAARFNDAFWRIWCFCKIFGCDKGREDDITGQLDWLKGGLLANNQGCVATVNTNLDFDMSSVLLNPPDYFAKANERGLYATQLFDMTEIWTCLTVLLQGYQGRVDQARRHGVFDGTGVVEGDVEQEEQMLEEWTAYLMTLGPSVVLEMAEYASDTSDAGFALAEAYGWTKWTPPVYNGSRTSFLKEPVAKSYEEQVLLAKLRLQDPLEQEKKEKSRQRVATLAAEIRLRRQSSEYKRLPLIDMNTERPMSMVSRTGSSRSRRSVVSRSTTTSRRPSTQQPTPMRHGSTLSPTSPSTLWAAPRAISPIIEERVDGFNRMTLRNLGGVAEDTSDMAVAKIVSMGFSAAEASKALQMTDMGDGIRLDRAVELLLRQQ